MNIRILVAGRLHFGGLLTEANTLAKFLRNREHDVRFIHIWGENEFLFPREKFTNRTDRILKNREILAVFAFKIAEIIIFSRLLFSHFRKKVDVVIAFEVLSGNSAYLFHKIFKVKVIQKVLASMNKDLINQGKINPNSWAHKYLIEKEKFAYQKAFKVIPNSIWLQDYIKKVANPCNLTEPLAAPLSGVSSKPDEKLIFNLKEKMRIKANEFVVLFPGRFDKRKGVHFLAEAIKKMLLELNIRDLKFYLLGSGPEEGEIKEDVLSSKIGDQVIFPGVIPHEKIKDFLFVSDVLVSPSFKDPQTNAEESLSYSVIEAMAYGVPPVCSKVGGIKNFLKNGITGFLFEEGNLEEFINILLKLKKNILLRKKIGIEAKRQAQEIVRNLYKIEKYILAAVQR